MYISLKKAFPEITLIVSGGVANQQDLIELSEANIDAVVVGKAYYENRITLEQMKSLSE